MNNNKVKVWLPLLFSFAMIIGMYLGYKMRDAMPGKSFFYTEKRRPVQEIIDLINNKYVDDVNMQAITDSLCYNFKDSLMVLYIKPIIWLDSTQLTADTITIKFKDKKADLILLRRNSFIASVEDSVRFN